MHSAGYYYNGAFGVLCVVQDVIEMDQLWYSVLRDITEMQQLGYCVVGDIIELELLGYSV